MAAKLNMTEARQRILRSAVDSLRGVVMCPYHVGFERVSWKKNAAMMVAAGLLTEYVHGGFEITDAGRAVWSELDPNT